MHDTGMDEVGIGMSDLRHVVRRLDTGALRGLIRGSKDDGPEARDWSQVRMTFPCEVTVHLRSGGVLETAGREHGACGAPLAEQQMVVQEKFEAVRDAADMPTAWRRRPEPAQPQPAAAAAG
jgi:hypothetical protein